MIDEELIDRMARAIAVKAYVERGYVSETTASDAFVTAEKLADDEINNSNWYHYMAQAALAEYRQAIRDSGYAVVPVEPTEAMIGAAERYMDNHILMAEDIYRAMIAASQGEG